MVVVEVDEVEDAISVVRWLERGLTAGQVVLVAGASFRQVRAVFEPFAGRDGARRDVDMCKVQLPSGACIEFRPAVGNHWGRPAPDVLVLVDPASMHTATAGGLREWRSPSRVSEPAGVEGTKPQPDLRIFPDPEPHSADGIYVGPAPVGVLSGPAELVAEPLRLPAEYRYRKRVVDGPNEVELEYSGPTPAGVAELISAVEPPSSA